MLHKILISVFFVVSIYCYNCPELGDLQIFPVENWWNTDVSEYPVNPNSDKIIETINKNARPGKYQLHPDYGAVYGIPYYLAGKEKIEIKMKQIEETDFGPMPIPLDAPVEGLFAAKDIPKYPDPHTYDHPKGMGGD